MGSGREIVQNRVKFTASKPLGGQLLLYRFGTTSIPRGQWELKPSSVAAGPSTISWNGRLPDGTVAQSAIYYLTLTLTDTTNPKRVLRALWSSQVRARTRPPTTHPAANPRGQWATTGAVKAALIGKPLQAMTCTYAAGSACAIGADPQDPTIDDATSVGYSLVKVGVVRARVSGFGQSKLVKGQRRYQLFKVWACARDFTQGGAGVVLHALWHTSRPRTYNGPGEAQPWFPWILDAYGLPYAEDLYLRGWFPIFGFPLNRETC